MNMENTLQRYIWLYNTIKRANGITLKEINEQWKTCRHNDDGKEIARRTFNDHRHKMEECFGIIIECNKSNNTYYIKDEPHGYERNIRDWLIKSLETCSIIRESEHIQNKIALENIQSDGDFLTDVVLALRENKVITFEYHSFNRNHSTQHTLKPLALKLFRQRWYVIGQHLDDDKIRIFSLDRIEQLIIEAKTFIYPSDFDVNYYYNESFGIIIEDGVHSERVRLKVNSSQVRYLETLKLHHSQRVIEHTPTYSIFEYKLKPTYDFIQEIMSHLDDIEILEPKSLRNEIRQIVKKMYEKYNDGE